MVVPLDSDVAVPQVTAAVGELLRQLETAGLRDDVGVGLLSMLGFESTCNSMEVRGLAGHEGAVLLVWDRASGTLLARCC